MLIDLEKLSKHDLNKDYEGLALFQALIAIAERLDRIAEALERPQQGAYLSPEE